MMRRKDARVSSRSGDMRGQQYLHVLDISKTISVSEWPRTASDDWCGEFVPQGGTQ